MPKKRPTRPPLRVVPPPSPAPLTFGDQVAQAMELYKAQKEPYKLLNLVCDLAVYPATTSIQTADPLIRYFALAAWYWQAEAIRREERCCRAQEEVEALSEERDEVFTDAIVEGEWVLRGLIQQLYAQLGASGAPDPTLQEGCTWLIQAFPEAMHTAMAAAEATRADAQSVEDQAEDAEAD